MATSHSTPPASASPSPSSSASMPSAPTSISSGQSLSVSPPLFTATAPLPTANTIPLASPTEIMALTSSLSPIPSTSAAPSSPIESSSSDALSSQPTNHRLKPTTAPAITSAHPHEYANTSTISSALQPVSVTDDDDCAPALTLSPAPDSRLPTQSSPPRASPLSPIGSPVSFPLASPTIRHSRRLKGNPLDCTDSDSPLDISELPSNQRDASSTATTTTTTTRSRAKRERSRHIRNDCFPDPTPPTKRPTFLHSHHRRLPMLNGALSIINRVQQSCGDRPEAFTSFTEALSRYNQDRDLIAVLDTISSLFAFSPDLIDTIRRFLPADPRLHDLPPLDSDLPADQQQPINGLPPSAPSQEATDFIEKVQERFKSCPYVYPAFLKLLQKYKRRVDHDRTACDRIRKRVAKLFLGHADLVREFEQFL